jgi:putative peptidoglycan lipid II flippase
VNLSGYLDAILAGFLATGALSAIGFAQILYLLPISLFGASVAAAELPELSRERSHWGEESARALQKNIMRSLYFLLPSAIAYLAFGDTIVRALFGRGLFGEADILLVWAVLGVYTLGLPASALSRVLSSVFFAQRDTRTPAAIAYARVALSAVVGLLLMFPLDRTGIGGGLRLGAVGLAFGATAGAWLEFTLLRRALRKRAFISPVRNGGLTRVLLAGGVAAVVGLAVDHILLPLHPWLHLICVLLPFGGVYLGMTYLLNAADPLKELLARRSVGRG